MRSALVLPKVGRRLKDRSSIVSRTDVHRPGWVKEQDPTLRHLFAEDHNHTNGGCDLAARQAEPLLPWGATSCHMRYVGWRNIYCGCRLCTGHHWRKQQHSRERAASRQDARLWLKGGEPRPAKNLATW